MENNFIKTHRVVLDTSLVTLRFAGLWNIDPNHSRFIKLCYNIYKTTVISIIIIFATTITASIYKNRHDFLIVTDDGCYIAGMIAAIFKNISFQLNRARIQKLIDRVHEPVDLLRCSSDQGVLKLVKGCILFERIIHFQFSFLCATMTIALFFLTPTGPGELPIAACYPFPQKEPPYYYLALGLQAAAVCIGFISVIHMDCIVLGLCLWIRIQLIVLGANYENCTNSERASINIHPAKVVEKSDRTIIPKTPVNEEEKKILCFIPFELGEAEIAYGEDVDNFVTRYTTCIKHHQRLRVLTEEMNAIFSAGMLVQLLSSTMMLCFTGFQALLGDKESGSFVKFAPFMVAAFLQIFYWSFIGNELKYQSSSLAESQWFSGWEQELTAEVTFLVIISMQSTKITMDVKAGKFYTMSMETFIAILRASYSAFTLMTTTKVDNDD